MTLPLRLCHCNYVIMTIAHNNNKPKQFLNDAKHMYLLTYVLTKLALIYICSSSATEKGKGASEQQKQQLSSCIFNDFFHSVGPFVRTTISLAKTTITHFQNGEEDGGRRRSWYLQKRVD